jgi:predicted  nucleic acid-binding Zn-ribbon protein
MNTKDPKKGQDRELEKAEAEDIKKLKKRIAKADQFETLRVLKEGKYETK